MIGDINIFFYTRQQQKFVLKVSPPELSRETIDEEDAVTTFLHRCTDKEKINYSSVITSLDARIPVV